MPAQAIDRVKALIDGWSVLLDFRESVAYSDTLVTFQIKALLGAFSLLVACLGVSPISSKFRK